MFYQTTRFLLSCSMSIGYPDSIAVKVAFEIAPLLVEYHKEGILANSPALELNRSVDLVETDPFTLEQDVHDWLGSR
jgi:hypothetical protein